MDNKVFKKDGTLIRNKMLFINYIKVIKDLGENATHVSKNRLYTLACAPFPGLKPYTAGCLIRGIYKSHQQASDLEYLLTQEQASDILETLRMLHERADD